MPFGWIAAADKDGEPWVDGGQFHCPKAPTTWQGAPGPAVAHRRGVLQPQDARRSRRGSSSPRRPAASTSAGRSSRTGWRARARSRSSSSPTPSRPSPSSRSSIPASRPARFHPGVDEPDWIDVTVTGHFDDQAAKTCKGKSTESGVKVPIGRDEIVTSCRGLFVITGIKNAGDSFSSRVTEWASGSAAHRVATWRPATPARARDRCPARGRAPGAG